MIEIIRANKPIFWAVIGGIIVGSFQGMDIDENYPPVTGPLSILIPFGIFAPPIIVLVQLPRFRRGLPKWLFKIYRHFNTIFFLAFMGLSNAATGLTILGSFDQNDPRVGVCAFFGAVGIGFILAALIMQRWAKQSLS